MEEEQKIKRCLTCKKRLLDEKVPFCLRCRLSGRNKTAKVGSAGVALIYAGVQLVNLVDSKDNPNDIV